MQKNNGGSWNVFLVTAAPVSVSEHEFAKTGHVRETLEIKIVLPAVRRMQKVDQK